MRGDPTVAMDTDLSHDPEVLSALTPAHGGATRAAGVGCARQFTVAGFALQSESRRVNADDGNEDDPVPAAASLKCRPSRMHQA
jgi:hypothetical protein